MQFLFGRLSPKPTEEVLGQSLGFMVIVCKVLSCDQFSKSHGGNLAVFPLPHWVSRGGISTTVFFAGHVDYGLSYI